MKYSSVIIILVFAALFSCKDNLEKALPNGEQSTLETQKDPLDVISEEQEKELADAYFYVIALSGLSLRKSVNLSSEKIALMPLGSKVKQVSPMSTIDMEIEHIPGSMMEVTYDGLTGYAFSGFLSPFPVPVINMSAKEYVHGLGKDVHSMTYSSKANDPDFHEGMTETMILPKAEWHEAFYLAASLFSIPEVFNFPNPKGKAMEIIEIPDKKRHAWSSDLSIYRNTSSIDSITYSYRAEGYGYHVTIKKAKENAMLIKHLGFVD